MNTLEKAINLVRINPAALASVSVGITYYIHGLNKIITEHIDPGSLEAYLNPAISGPFVGMGTLWILSFLDYQDIRRGLKTHGITKEYVERHLEHYCNRQACRAAAIREGVEEEFNEINKNFPKEKKRFAWIPEL